MKKGQIILGAAAFIVTAASSLAFKAHSKFIGQHRLLGATSAGSSNCTRSTCFTNVNGAQSGKCHTVVNNRNTAFTHNGTLWTSFTTINGIKCANPTIKWTHTN